MLRLRRGRHNLRINLLYSRGRTRASPGGSTGSEVLSSGTTPQGTHQHQGDPRSRRWRWHSCWVFYGRFSTAPLGRVVVATGTATADSATATTARASATDAAHVRRRHHLRLSTARDRGGHGQRVPLTVVEEHSAECFLSRRPRLVVARPAELGMVLLSSRAAEKPLARSTASELGESGVSAERPVELVRKYALTLLRN
jgi:hypothetical protein